MENNSDNLDYYCTKYGLEIPNIKDDHSSIQKALGVLQEDGLFAYSIFLEYMKKNEGEVAKNMQEKSKDILEDLEIIDEDDESLKSNMEHLAEDDLDTLFLTKDILEKMLIYARYHAKALSNKTGDNSDEE